MTEKKNNSNIEFLKNVADQVVKRSLTPLAILYLESHKPLSFAFSQLMHVATPFASIFINTASLERFATIMQERENVEILIQLIEKRQDEFNLENNKNKKENKNDKKN